jgi:hypothetical protein
MTEPRHANPDPETPADDTDALDWDPERDGRMADHADDDEPTTEPWEG